MPREMKDRDLLGKFSDAGRVFVGLVRDGAVIETKNSTMMETIRGGLNLGKRRHALSDLKTLPPIDKPSKIICIGLNYRSHIREMKAETPRVPIIFSKPSSAIIGQDDEIVLPNVSSRVDYEGESALVIGKRASRTKDGSSHIFGFTCFNDVTARDLQRIDPDWTRAKGFDTFAPIGPFISMQAPTRVLTRLNGKVVQDALLTDRVFGDASLVEYISTVMTLEPGDVIATGTPSGISPMRLRDVVEIELDGIGCLRNKVGTG
jgi:2-keto-4-pentenoate hydratase/2-oxohepta-3-ene-1,7-dioic acid hydratase in catechol pathway